MVQFISGRFAAKEAVVKCLGTGMIDGLSLTDIQILRKINGQPFIELAGEAKRIADELGVNRWHLSISHSNSTSMAFVVAEKESLSK